MAMNQSSLPVQEEYDAMVIGSGGAGMRASLELAQSGYRTIVLTKVYPTRSHTVAAQGGVNAALGNNDEGGDDWRFHFYDTVMGSDFLADQDAVEIMCEQAPKTVIELEQMGLPFSRNDDGKIYQRAFGGQSREYGKHLVHRTCAAADRTGHAMLHTLYQQNIAAETVFYNEWFALDLVKASDGKTIAGALAMCIETGEIRFIKAKLTVLATGGAGKIYHSTTNAYSCTGDGFGMAVRAGMALQDMEMWQFHPTGIAGCGVLITEGSRGEGGYLLNAKGERFMESYAPHSKDLSCRDVVSRCSLLEIREGRGCGPNKDHVLLKLDHLGPEVLAERLPGISELAMTFAGVDVNKDPIPVVPTCHYLMGGIPTNPQGQVLTCDAKGRTQIIPGLYAAGEAACVSVHGANRLGANSLLDIVVFGRLAAKHMVETLHSGVSSASVSSDDYMPVLDRCHRWDKPQSGEDFASVRANLQRVMQDHFGVFRQQDSMQQGLDQLNDLAEALAHARLDDHSKAFNTARIEALELDNLMETAMATAHSALARQESRGAHSRVDFPKRDDKKWHCHSVYKQGHNIIKRPVNMKPKSVEAIALAEREQ